MVNLLTGPKGSGKTQQMIEQANKQAKECKGNVVFIKKTHRDTASVAFDIRTICMDDFPSITNTDEYIEMCIRDRLYTVSTDSGRRDSSCQ